MCVCVCENIPINVKITHLVWKLSIRLTLKQKFIRAKTRRYANTIWKTAIQNASFGPANKLTTFNKCWLLEKNFSSLLSLFNDYVWGTYTEGQFFSQFNFDAFLKSEVKSFIVLPGYNWSPLFWLRLKFYEQVNFSVMLQYTAYWPMQEKNPRLSERKKMK